MLLASKISGAIARSTYFAHDHHVDDENCQWHDAMEDDLVNFVDGMSGRVMKIFDDTFDGLSCQCSK